MIRHLPFLLLIASTISWYAPTVSAVPPQRPPDGMIYFAVLGERAALVPESFIQGINPDLIQCESSWDKNKVGKAGELGLLQIHPIHFQRMRQVGLNHYDEADRVWFAGNVIYRESGLSPWTCAQH